MNVKQMMLVYGGIAVGITTLAHAAAPEPIPPTTLDFRNTATGEPLDLNQSLPTGRDTAGMKEFFKTGHDPYLEDPSCLRLGQSLFLTGCSGCHGEVGQGDIGPGLNDDYWTYPKNETDAGIFSTIWGGARAQMGPHYTQFTLDQMLQIIAWVRHLYKDPVSKAYWLSPEQKKNYKPYTKANGKMIAALPASTPGRCKAAALQPQNGQ